MEFDRARPERRRKMPIFSPNLRIVQQTQKRSMKSFKQMPKSMLTEYKANRLHNSCLSPHGANVRSTRRTEGATEQTTGPGSNVSRYR